MQGGGGGWTLPEYTEATVQKKNEHSGNAAISQARYYNCIRGGINELTCNTLVVCNSVSALVRVRIITEMSLYGVTG